MLLRFSLQQVLNLVAYFKLRLFAIGGGELIKPLKQYCRMVICNTLTNYYIKTNFLRRCCVISLSLFFGAQFNISYANNYSIAAGSPSGLYYPYAGNLAALWSSKIEDFNMKAEVTDASLVNVVQVAVGDSEASFAQGDVVMDAFSGRGKFRASLNADNQDPLDIAVLFGLYPNLVHLITHDNAKLNTIDDLKGKKISVGAPGSGTAITALNILETLGISPEDFSIQYLDYIETANAIRDGNIHAGFIVSGIGVAVIVELALTRDIKLINFSDEQMDLIQAQYPSYTPFKLDESIYKGVASVQTPSVWNVLVVNKHMDDELAYQLTRTTFENIEQLRKTMPVAAYTTPENAHCLKGVPLHPGAERYFKEISTEFDCN